MKKTVFLIAMALLLLFTGCNASEESPDASEGSASVSTYTVEIKTVGGMPLSDVTVRIYTDSEMDDIVCIAETDREGKLTFDAEQRSEGYVAVSDGIPQGYKVEESYLIDQANTQILLETELLDAADLGNASYELGSIVHDFTVKASDGTEYRISELLMEKKAVVLNFWFSTCQPCRLEFPYLQNAYEEYKDVLEVLALNPADGTDASVSAFASELGLTFPMAACELDWQNYMNLRAYPTTVVIDRYGMVAMVHMGSVTEEGVFESVFEYFTSDDYKQTTVRNLSDIQ